MKSVFAVLLIFASFKSFAADFQSRLICKTPQGYMSLSPHSRSAKNSVLAIDQRVADALRAQIGDAYSALVSEKFEYGSVENASPDQFNYVSDEAMVFSKEGGIKLVLGRDPNGPNFYFRGCQFE